MECSGRAGGFVETRGRKTQRTVPGVVSSRPRAMTSPVFRAPTWRLRAPDPANGPCNLRACIVGERRPPQLRLAPVAAQHSPSRPRKPRPQKGDLKQGRAKALRRAAPRSTGPQAGRHEQLPLLSVERVACVASCRILRADRSATLIVRCGNLRRRRCERVLVFESQDAGRNLRRKWVHVTSRVDR